jgi:hypothetical protein
MNLEEQLKELKVTAYDKSVVMAKLSQELNLIQNEIVELTMEINKSKNIDINEVNKDKTK